jgi:hypothetical protein
MIGNAHGHTAIGFQARPLVAGGVTQIGGDIAHVTFLIRHDGDRAVMEI